MWISELREKPVSADGDGNLPLISVVTPSYNQGGFLESTIRSVLLQGYPNLEYLLMDGGSIDGSVEIIRKYASHLAYWESGPDGGQYSAIQKGFENSHGEIMAWLNSDDIYFPWTLRAVGEIFRNFPQIEWLTTSRPCVIPPGGQFPTIWNHFRQSRHRFLSTRGKLFFTQGFIQQESTFWRRSLWERTGAKLRTDLYYAGDFELWSRFHAQTVFTTVAIPLAAFRYHEGQKTDEVLEGYIPEAEKILSAYPRPLQLPGFAIRFLNRAYHHYKSDLNWLGLRCDNVTYDARQDQWILRKALEWRE